MDLDETQKDVVPPYRASHLLLEEFSSLLRVDVTEELKEPKTIIILSSVRQKIEPKWGTDYDNFV